MDAKVVLSEMSAKRHESKESECTEPAIKTINFTAKQCDVSEEE